MKHTLILSTVLVLLAGILTGNVQAKDYQLGKIVISDPWARTSPSRAKNGAAYIPKLMNHGQAMDRLIAVSSTIAKKTELHLSTVEDGIAKMHHVKGINLAPGKPAVMKPGGYHIMLMGLSAPLKMGDSFSLILTFEKAGKIEVMVPVKKSNRPHGMKMDHGKM